MQGTSALVFLTSAAFAAGVVDAIAGGGGLIVVPALLATGLPPHLVLGTNKGQSTFGAISSFLSYWRRGWIDTERAPVGLAAGFVGSLLGGFAVLSIAPEPLRPIVLVLLVAAAILITTRRSLTPKARDLRHPLVVLGFFSLLLGAYDGFFGPGTGSLLIVVFVTVFGDTLTRASANAKGVNLASNVAAFLLFAWRGTIVWSYALPMALANAAGAALGARLAIKHGDRFVRVVVLVVVFAVTAKVGFQLLSR